MTPVAGVIGPYSTPPGRNALLGPEQRYVVMASIGFGTYPKAERSDPVGLKRLVEAIKAQSFVSSVYVFDRHLGRGLRSEELS